MRAAPPAIPSQPGIIAEFLQESSLSYADCWGPYGDWIHPTLVRKITNGRYFRTVRVPYDTGLRALAAHPALESGPVIVNDFARVITFLLPLGTRPEHWNVPGTRFLRPGATVELPPAAAVRCRDIHWMTPPATHRDFVVSDLATAVNGAPLITAPSPGPRP
ncbi:hypothetical protein ACFYXL_22875 [Streptomyces tsukubensis]|uniref:hypothetical protein n=1 Tax=Streptomyces tsukubensis TaxID=83656 RepID=UPI0036A94C2E